METLPTSGSLVEEVVCSSMCSLVLPSPVLDSLTASTLSCSLIPALTGLISPALAFEAQVPADTLAL